MVGKRQPALRRTVSASMMGSESNIFESSPVYKYSSEKQEFPVLSSHCPNGMLASTKIVDHNPMQVLSSKSNHNAKPTSLAQSDSEFPSPAFPLLHKFLNKTPTLSSSWNRNEIKSVGLGVVAAYAEESLAMIEVKDGKKEAPPHVLSKNSIMQPDSFHFPHHNVLMQGRSAVFLHELLREDEYNNRSTMALTAADFLEACYFCKRRLSHGFDIYMYRGDQAFCSEECRYEQIVFDERKEKCNLQALKMKTSVPSLQSTDQRTQRMTSGTVTAG